MGNHQGDTIPFGFQIFDINTDRLIPRDQIGDIVFQINDDNDEDISIELLLSRDEISYDPDSRVFYFELTQEQSFKLPENSLYQVRVYDSNHKVLSHDIDYFDVGRSINHRVFGKDEQ